MDKKNWLDLISTQTQVAKVMETNQYTQQFGLTLTEKDAHLIMAERKETLTTEKRVEFGSSILPELIHEFCDSNYIRQDNYTETIIELQRIFYAYKNEMMDEISDTELLHFMSEQFDEICFGDLDYLEGTCLANFAQAIRAGYDGYRQTDGRGEYAQFDNVPRWDKELYMEVLRELCWR